MPTIELTPGVVVTYSEEDESLVGKYCWHLHKSKTKRYARGYLKGSRNSGLVYMHRIIMRASRSEEVDHADCDGLNNVRTNLRKCTRTQNNANRKGGKYKGVHFESSTGKFRALIHFKGKKISLGRFSDIDDAKNAYNNKAKELFGDFYRP